MSRRIPIKYKGITENGEVCTGDLSYKRNGEPCIRFWTENGYTIREIVPDSLEMMAVKPEIFSDGDYNGEPVYDMYECPNCGVAGEVEYRDNYCQHCGQRLDWSDFEGRADER